MSACFSGGRSSDKSSIDRRYRHILWIALFVNAAMFIAEVRGELKAAGARA